MTFAHIKRLMLATTLVLFGTTSYPMNSTDNNQNPKAAPISSITDNWFATKKAEIYRTLTQACGEPVGAALCYLGIPVAVELSKLGVQGIFFLAVKTKDLVIRYNYTPEEAKSEIIAIQAADNLDLRESRSAALAQHCIYSLESLFGRHKILNGDPKLEEHAAILEKTDPEYAKFLVCINRYHKYGNLVSAIPHEQEIDPEYGACRPPFNVLQYLEKHPNKKSYQSYLKKLGKQKDIPDQSDQSENPLLSKP